MNFGPASPDLLPGAKNAVETCLSIKPGEKVALVADEPSRAVAASLAAAIENLHAPCTSLLLAAFAPRPIKPAPAPVLDALETADVGILCMSPQPGELAARMAIVKVVERRQIRYAHMVRVPPETMHQGLRADYRMVDRLSDKLSERMRRDATLP